MEHKIISLASGTKSRPASDHLRDWSSSSEAHFGLEPFSASKNLRQYFETCSVLSDSRTQKKMGHVSLFSKSGIFFLFSSFKFLPELAVGYLISPGRSGQDRSKNTVMTVAAIYNDIQI